MIGSMSCARARVLTVLPALNHPCMFLPLGAILLAVSACTARLGEQDVDRSFLTGRPCPPPCWYLLKVDESDTEQVLSTLGGLDFVLPGSIRETGGGMWLNETSATAIHFSCPYSNDCGTLIVSQAGVLKGIYLQVGYDLTLRQVVNSLGPPEYIDFGTWHPEVISCQVNLNWPARLVSIQILQKSSEAICENLHDGGTLLASTEVAYISYLSAEGFRPNPGPGLRRIPWPGMSET